MIKDVRERLGKYLKYYIDLTPGHNYSYSDEDVIQESVSELINHNIFTPEELQKDIFKKCSILPPLSDIKKWAEK